MVSDIKFKTSVLYRTVLFRQDMKEFIEKSIESLILNYEYIDNIILLKNDKINSWDFSKLYNVLKGKVNIIEVVDETLTNYRSFELGVKTFVNLPDKPKLLSFLDADDAYLPGGLKMRIETKNVGVQLSRLETIEYKHNNDGWAEIGRTRSNYMPSFRQSARYRNSAFSSGLIVTRRFIENAVLKAFERLESQMFDMIHEDFLIWSLAQLLDNADFLVECTGIYRRFGFVRKEKYPQDADAREVICRENTMYALNEVLKELGQKELIKDTITGLLDVSYSGLKINF